MAEYQRLTASERSMLRAAFVARQLIGKGELDPWDGLGFVVMPTEAMAEAACRNRAANVPEHDPESMRAAATE